MPVLLVSDLEIQSVGQPLSDRDPAAQRAEPGQAVVAREFVDRQPAVIQVAHGPRLDRIRLIEEEVRLIEARGRLAVGADRRRDHPAASDGLVPRGLDGVGPDPPVVAKIPVGEVERRIQTGEVLHETQGADPLIANVGPLFQGPFHLDLTDVQPRRVLVGVVEGEHRRLVRNLHEPGASCEAERAFDQRALVEDPREPEIHSHVVTIREQRVDSVRQPDHAGVRAPVGGRVGVEAGLDVARRVAPALATRRPCSNVAAIRTTCSTIG